MNHCSNNVPPPSQESRALITALVGDGWEVWYTAPRPQVQTARLVSPDDLLHMTIDQNILDGSAHIRMGILPGGSGEPAHWRACDPAPSSALWRAAARAALHAQDGTHRPALYPGEVLVRLGWVYSKTRRDGRVVEEYTCLSTNRSLTYHYSARGAPALWTITRPETSIGVAVTAAEPYALPALVLALILEAPDN
ncbi:hypothetical protein [Actinospica robiniae]|uniref:hypothetical protein n=1 Tax=Actinospica robiniae TaxID=304901 RepID=UPI0003F79095|nr:hypothetical protein [Actinospica robiniae]